MRQIKMQKQITHNGCMSACLAMLMDRSVSYVAEGFHDDFINHCVLPEVYLRREDSGVHLYPRAHGLQCNHIEAGYLYLLTVPSLNAPGMLHAVVLDCREPEDTKVYDPATGQVYLSPHQYEGEPGTTQLVSWEVKYTIEFEEDWA